MNVEVIIKVDCHHGRHRRLRRHRRHCRRRHCRRSLSLLVTINIIGKCQRSRCS